MSRDARPQNRLAMTMAEERPDRLRHVSAAGARASRRVSLQDLAESTKISARVLESLERNDPSKLPGGISRARSCGPTPARSASTPTWRSASFVDGLPGRVGRRRDAGDHPRRRGRELRTAAARGPGARAGARRGAAGGHHRVPLLFALRPGAPAERPAASQAPEGAASSAPPALPTSQAPAAAPAPRRRSGRPSRMRLHRRLRLSSSGRRARGCGARPRRPGTPPRRRLRLGPAGVRRRVLDFGERGRDAQPSRTVAAGERIEFAVQQSITLTAGNAGALSMTLNGRPARALGAAGEVVTRRFPPPASRPSSARPSWSRSTAHRCLTASGGERWRRTSA